MFVPAVCNEYLAWLWEVHSGCCAFLQAKRVHFLAKAGVHEWKLGVRV